MILKHLILLLLCIPFVTHIAYSQQLICLGDDITVCEGQSVDIANCTPGGAGTFLGGLHLENPTVIPTLTDDSWSAACNVGFDFTFYGNVFSQFTIGSNGIISFNLGNAGGGCPWALGGVGQLPSTGTPAAHNSIMPAYQDMNPSVFTSPDGNIQYETIGTAPNRMCVILYKEIGAFQCGIAECNYLGVVLYETSNNIEIHVGKKTVCAGWNGGLAIQGIQNNNGTIAHITPGRNNTIWNADNDARRWHYNGGNDYTIEIIPYVQVTGAGSSLVWNNEAGETFPYTQVLNVTNPPPGTTGYYLTASACGTALGAVSDTSYITTAAPEVIVSATDDVCSQGIGSVSAVPGVGSPPPYTYSWPALGAATQNVNNVLAGTYSVSMVDGNGCNTSANITVNDNPTDFFGSMTPVSCAGGSDGTATAAMLPTDGTETFLWDNNETTATITNLTEGTYNCMITSPGGCTGNISVTVYAIPSLTLEVANQIDALCNSFNDGVINIGVTNGTAPYSYEWDQSTCITNEATDLFAGTHNLTVTDDNGCVESITTTIGEPDPLSITNISEDSMVCSDAFIDIEATGSGGSSPYIFTWTANGVELAFGQSITVNPNTNDTEYCVTLSEECGSPEANDCLSITFPDDILPIITPDYEKLCDPADFIFTNNTTNGIEVQTTNYIFSNGDSFTTNGIEALACSFENPGIYDCFVTITSNYGCVYTQEFENIIEVTTPPEANFSISKNPATWFETEIQTNESCIGDVVEYDWYSQGALSVLNNGGSAFITYPEGIAGTYPITLVATTNEGCSDTITFEIDIVPDIIFYAPNSFTPDNDEHNQTWSIIVEGVDYQNFSLEIYNKWGETIWETRDIKAEWDGTYNNQKVPEGTYIWKAIYKERENDGRKIHTGYINLIR